METQEQPEAPRHPKQWLLVVIVDVLVLAELAFSMYLSSLHPEDFEWTFMKCFFGMLLPTLAFAFAGKRYLCHVDN